jgi:hypothetical protein
MKNNLFFVLESGDLKAALTNTDYEIRDLRKGTYIFHEQATFVQHRKACSLNPLQAALIMNSYSVQTLP